MICVNLTFTILFIAISGAAFAEDIVLNANTPGIVGQELELRCVLQPKFLVKYPQCNARTIYFLPNHNSSVQVISEIEAVFTQNITTPTHYSYICAVNTILCENLTGNVFARKIIHWGYAPVVPQFEPCVVSNWERMVCTWGPKQTQIELVHKTKTNATWETESRKGHCGINEHNHPHECVFSEESLNITEKYTIRVAVWNDVGVESNNITVDPLMKVKINQLSIKVGKVASKMAEVTWIPPTTSHKDPVVADFVRSSKYLYKTIVEENGNSKESFFERETFTSVHYLENLKPATSYGINLSVKTIQGGYFSNPVFANFSTLEDVPGEDPVMFNGGFTRTENGVIVKWRGISPDKKHGRIGYKLCIEDIDFGDILNVETGDQNYIELKENLIKTHHQYKVSVITCTAVGCTRPCVTGTGIATQGVVIPKRGTVEAPGHVIAVSDDSNSSMTVHWSHTHERTSYVVFWCERADIGICKDKLNSTGIIPASEDPSQSRSISLASSELPVLRYAVGVSAVRDNTYSGIKWFTGCFFQANRGAGSPTSVTAVSKDYNTLVVSWRTPDCHQDTVGFSELILVFHCPAEGGECFEKAETKKVLWYKEEATLSDLKSSSEYKVWVTGDADGQPSSATVLATVSIYWLDQKGVLPGLVVGVLLFGSIAILGIIVLYRKMCAFKKKMTHLEYVDPPEIETGTTNTYRCAESLDSGRGSIPEERSTPTRTLCSGCQCESPLVASTENSDNTVVNPNYVLAPPSAVNASSTSSTVSNTKILNYVEVALAEDGDDIVFSNNEQMSECEGENCVKIQPETIFHDTRVIYNQSRGACTSPVLRDTTSPQPTNALNATENDAKNNNDSLVVFQSASNKNAPSGYVTEDDLKRKAFEIRNGQPVNAIETEYNDRKGNETAQNQLTTTKNPVSNHSALGYVDHRDLAKFNIINEEESGTETINDAEGISEHETKESNENIAKSSLTQGDSRSKSSARNYRDEDKPYILPKDQHHVFSFDGTLHKDQHEMMTKNSDNDSKCDPPCSRPACPCSHPDIAESGGKEGDQISERQRGSVDSEDSGISSPSADITVCPEYHTSPNPDGYISEERLNALMS